jgi:hypothetical protein
LFRIINNSGVVFAAAFLFVSCSKEFCYKNYFANVTDYSIRITTTTKDGMGVDASGLGVDLDAIDRTVRRMESCLERVILDGHVPDMDAQCLDTLRPLPMRRDCLKIKIVQPVRSECSEWHFLKETAPEELCIAKDVKPSEECPCRWRWAVQDDNHLVVPLGHADYMYLYDIVRIHTGCNNYWADPRLAECACEVLNVD